MSTAACMKWLPDFRPTTLILLVSLAWLPLFNLPVLSRVWPEGSGLGSGSDLTVSLALMVLILAIHALLLGLVGLHALLKPIVIALTLIAAVASHFIEAYGVMLDPSMLRNTLATHPAEAGELLTAPLAMALILKGVLPAVVLMRVPVLTLTWRRAIAERLLLLSLTAVLALAAVWAAYQPLASLMRNQRELRYLITPINVLWSGTVALKSRATEAAIPREPVGLDARPGESWGARRRPLVVVVVVGEPARAAHGGHNPGARDTTPALEQLPVINFSQVDSCGTNTEVSVPCMFAPVGRRDYQEDRIHRQESLLHVLHRAGVQVHWLDNQSGCKGVCDGLPSAMVKEVTPGGCPAGGCLDDRLLEGFQQRLSEAQGTQVWVLHMLGNHGPAYHRRYPAAFEHFTPACHDDDLHRCSIEAVVNAYDNALRFTDHVLAQAIHALQAASGRVDTALVYVSDHGESLGEKGLFLHGMPYRIAPIEQTRVPMVWWVSPGLDAAIGTPKGCTREALSRASAGLVAHDHLFHSLLGLLDVGTALHEPKLDFFAPCREPR